MLSKLITLYNTALVRLRAAARVSLSNSLTRISLLPHYYRVNDLLWQDGLLIDFLQKKVADGWIRRFLVCSSYLFSERTLFEFVVRFFVDFIVWPLTSVTALEFPNIAMTLMSVLLSLTLLVLLFNLSYLYLMFL